MKLTIALTIAIAKLIAASNGKVTVDVSTTTGETKFLGSNFIYGFPDNGIEVQSVIPDHFLTDIKFNACRAGGAQIAARGWGSGGYDEYIGRLPCPTIAPPGSTTGTSFSCSMTSGARTGDPPRTISSPVTPGITPSSRSF